MFEAQNKSQPKLVYTYAGQNQSNRDQEGKSSSAGISILSVTSIDKVKQQEPVSQRAQQNETKNHSFQSQQSPVQQKEQHKVQKQTKQETYIREVKPHELIKEPFRGFVTKKEQQGVDRSVKQSTQHQMQIEIGTTDQQQSIEHQKHLEVDQQQSKHEVDIREIQQLDQQRKPKQIEIGYISTKKGPTGSLVSAKKENNNIFLTKQSDFGENEHNKGPHHSTIAYNSGTIKREQSSTAQTDVHISEIRNRETFSHFEKIEPSLKPSVTISTENKAKMILSSSTSEHHVVSNSKISSNEVVLNDPGSSDTNTYDSKQAYIRPLTNTQRLLNQQQQQNILQPEHKVPGDFSKEVQDTTKHITSITVHSHPMERKQTWPLIPKSDNSHQSPKIPNTTSNVSYQSNSLKLTSSTKSPEDTLKSEINQDSTYSDAFPPSTPTTTSQPPKSILKNSTSFDQTIISPTSRSLTFSGLDSDQIPHFDFRSLLTSTKDTTSKTKGSTNMFKRQIKSPFLDKNISPPPQRKGRKASESSTSKDELQKEGLAPKKSVTFDSQVRLHLEDELSTVQTLLVDA